MPDSIFDVFSVLASGGVNKEAIHKDLKTAERLREMNKVQYAKVYILRLEGSIRMRDSYTSQGNEFYNRRKNSFSQWDSMQWSAALRHPYHLETESDTALFVRDFIMEGNTFFSNLDEIMESDDADSLVELANGYKTWIIEKLGIKGAGGIKN